MSGRDGYPQVVALLGRQMLIVRSELGPIGTERGDGLTLTQAENLTRALAEVVLIDSD